MIEYLWDTKPKYNKDIDPNWTCSQVKGTKPMYNKDMEPSWINSRALT